jgi:hypothetical protein
MSASGNRRFTASSTMLVTATSAPERHARQYVDPGRLRDTWAHLSNTLVALDQRLGLQFRPRNLDGPSKQPGIHVTQPRLEEIAKPFDNDAKKRAAVLLFERGAKEFVCPRLTVQAPGKQLSR